MHDRHLLGAEAVPQQHVGGIGRCDGGVHLGQEPVIVFVGFEAKVRIQEFEESLAANELGSELFPFRFGGENVLGFEDLFERGLGPVDAVETLMRGVDGVNELSKQGVDIALRWALPVGSGFDGDRLASSSPMPT